MSEEEHKDTKPRSENTADERCYICHRTEAQAGKMVHLPNDICICRDCLQRTIDSFGKGGGAYLDLSQVDPSMIGQFLGFNPMQPEASKNRHGKNIRQQDDTSEEAEESFDEDDEDAHKKDWPVLDLKALPAPHMIKAELDRYVIGQEHAKKAISVAVYNHYKRVAAGKDADDIEIEKSNMLLLGPTGSGKTYLVKTLARLLQVPLAITDATSLTEAGYIGDDVESVVSKLLANADGNIEEAEHGIIFIDEIDKIAKKVNQNSRDVSGEAVQQGLLKLLEGNEIEVPINGTSKNPMVPTTTVDTTNILFICGGAFPDIEQIIKNRLNKESSIGFKADLKDKYDKDQNLLLKVTTEDLREFGMIPEFLGRLPVVVPLEALDEDMLVKILVDPKNAILKQYQKLLALDEVDLEFDDSALHAIAQKAMTKKTGARALRAIIEDFMLDIMYEIPKDDNIGRVTITGDYINGRGAPLIELRTVTRPQIAAKP